jgi:DNA topoisomerase-6 subunit B
MAASRAKKKKTSPRKKTPVRTPARRPVRKRAPRTRTTEPETAEEMGRRQREISVSEFFLKNRHLLGFDSPRKALLTAVKEAVDNALDACEDAGILPEISVELEQISDKRFAVRVLDNGPGIVKDQIPKIFAKLLYGSKFHRLRMSRGQQGIGISAAGMYGQLTTGSATRIQSKIKGKKEAYLIEVQIDTKANKPAILRSDSVEWLPSFTPGAEGGKAEKPIFYKHGTSVEITLEGSYVRGRLSVDEFIKQCAIVNPHLQLHYRVLQQQKKGEEAAPDAGWFTYRRATRKLPKPAAEIKPHPHGVELGMLMQMLKDTSARTVRAALTQDFSRVSANSAAAICKRAGLDPAAKPTRIAHRESEALFKAINETQLMRPPTDCLSPIGEDQMLTGLKKEIEAEFYTASTRNPTVYRGNPFQVEVGLAYARPGENEELTGDDPIRIMRFANRVPLLYMAGGCAITRAVTGVNWKAYGMNQPRGSLPVGPMLITVHLASAWVPFTSESKEAVAHYPEILRELTFALQECGRRLSIYLKKRKRTAEAERKRKYITQYIPHLALGLKEVLELSDRQETKVVNNLTSMLEKTKLDV